MVCFTHFPCIERHGIERTWDDWLTGPSLRGPFPLQAVTDRNVEGETLSERHGAASD